MGNQKINHFWYCTSSEGILFCPTTHLSWFSSRLGFCFLITFTTSFKKKKNVILFVIFLVDMSFFSISINVSSRIPLYFFIPSNLNNKIHKLCSRITPKKKICSRSIFCTPKFLFLSHFSTRQCFSSCPGQES